jgi:hypothetical protein
LTYLQGISIVKYVLLLPRWGEMSVDVIWRKYEKEEEKKETM